MLALASGLLFGASICSVQSGTVTLPAQVAGSPTFVTLNPVIDARTVFFYGYRVASDQPRDHLIGMEGVVDGGTIYALRFNRGRGDASAAATWYVAEFCSGVVAERGVVAVTPTSVATHSTMAVNRSWGTTLQDNAGDQFSDDDHLRVRPLTPTELEVSNSDPLSSGDFRRWQIFESSGMTVQHGVGYLDAGELSHTIATVIVPMATSFSRVTWRSAVGAAGDTADVALSSKYLGAGNVEISRSMSQTLVEYAWDLVTFTDGTRVFTGRQGFNVAEGTISQNIGGSIDRSRAVAFTAGHDSLGRFSVGTDPGNARFTSRLIDATMLELERAAASSAAVVDWIVLEFPQGDGSAGGAGGGSGGGGTSGGNGGTGSAGALELQLALPQSSVVAGRLTGLIKVRVLDANKNAVALPADLTVTLNSSSSRGGFVLRQDDSIANPLDVTIPLNTLEAGAYYKDFSAGVDTLTASAPGLVRASAMLEITAPMQVGCGCGSAPGCWALLAIAALRRRGRVLREARCASTRPHLRPGSA